MPADLSGRVALVTGGARGIGFATATALRDAGAAVAITDIDQGAVEASAEQLGSAVFAMSGDISRNVDVQTIIERMIQRFGRLDIVVNNAGILAPTRFVDIPEAEWRRTIDINLTGVFLCIQAAVRHMIGNRYGRIVNVSSSAGKTVSTLGGAHYTASKSAVLGLTRAAAKELAPHGITVNAVCPGLIDTEMVRANTSEAQLQAYANSFPIARLGTDVEVAALICFLASHEAAYITGASVDINGGDLMV